MIEKVYKLTNGIYFHFQDCDDGIDFTYYKSNGNEIDGGIYCCEIDDQINLNNIIKEISSHLDLPELVKGRIDVTHDVINLYENKCDSLEEAIKIYDFYNSKNILKDEIKEKEQFDSIEFEKDIPKEMRFKETQNITNKNYGFEGIYWITQEPFTYDMLKQFAKAFSKNNTYCNAFVTCRDYSTYDFIKDLGYGDIAFVNKNGDVYLPDEFEKEMSQYFDFDSNIKI